MASTAQENIVQDGTCYCASPPRLADGETLNQRVPEKAVTTAERIGIALKFGVCDSGPPGSGKNVCGCAHDCELVNGAERKWELRRQP